MIVIENTMSEDIELVTSIDLDVEGCRLALPAPPPEILAPGETLCMMGYEPGISYTIRPVKDPERPRSHTIPPGKDNAHG